MEFDDPGRDEVLEDLQKEVAKWKKIAAQAATASLPPSPAKPRGSWAGPFARHGASAAPDPDDADMQSVSGCHDVGDQRVVNAPALPPHPVYEGSTLEERKAFMHAYQTYVRALSAFESSAFHPLVMPVSACIEDRTRWLIAHYHIKKPQDEVEESEWQAYFLLANEATTQDYELLDQAMKKSLRCDVSLTDATSRIDKLVKSMHAILDQHNLEIVVANEEPKRLVKYLLDALEPADFRSKIKHRLEQDTNKKYRKDSALFVEWVKEHLRSYMLWEPKGSKPDSRKTPPTGHHKQHGYSKTDHGGQPRDRKQDGGGDGQRDGRKPSHGGQTPGRGFQSPCLKCQSREHRVKDCPSVSPGEAERLVAEFVERKKKMSRLGADRRATGKSPSSAVLGEASTSQVAARDQGTARATISSHVVLDALLDTGADVSLVSSGVLQSLEDKGCFLEVAKVQTPVELSPLGAGRILVTRKVKLKNVELQTTAGPLMLPVVECWVEDKNPKHALILGRPMMQRLGYSTDGLLSSALRKLGVDPTVDKADSEPDLVSEDVPSPFKMNQLRVDAAREDGEDGADPFDERMELPTPKPASMNDMKVVLAARHAAALLEGIGGEAAEELRCILDECQAAFRLHLGADPPIKVEPLRVRLKPGAVPTRCSTRRLPPLHMDYVKKHIQELVDAGYLRRNNRSRYASPPRIVNKSTPGEFRMTVDVRGPNGNTEAMPWPMPILETLLAFLAEAECFFNLDADKMFWQLPLHDESQEMFTIMTVFGMFSPTRVLMGQTDAVAFCQSTMEKIFEPLLNDQLLVWLDDLLGHATTPMGLMKILRRVLTLCIEYGVKLNPHKCVFFTRTVKWCGRVVSAAGITHCPDRISGLVGMTPPRTAGDLQQFVCAVNWMRNSIPSYATMVSPLMELLEAAMKQVASRKKRALQKVDVSSMWTDIHEAAYDGIKSALMVIAPLAHPDQEATVCVFTDASLDHWGAAVTQLESEDEEKPITEQDHKPLGFLSGSFAGSSARWPIVEKEAYAIVETCKRLEYLLLRGKGFRIYTDHRNLVYIFDPKATDANMARYQADKLQRWSMTMMMFRYIIYHIAGEDNVWGDLLSRWGAPAAINASLPMAALAVVDQVSPLQADEFDWPSLDQVLVLQRQELLQRDPNGELPDVMWSEDDEVYKDDQGRVWIPDTAVDMQQRLCVVAHAGPAGHRGQAVTLKLIADLFVWRTMTEDVNSFVRACHHCLTVKGEKIPRPFGAALHATKPNEVLHFDFLSMPLGNDVSKYVLVLKDDFSGFTELVECPTADSDEVVAALLDWFKRFGVVLQWVSDQGSHFKNMVTEDLRKILGSQHHFVTAYSPWANGTVEVVNRLVLRVTKALLSELKQPLASWPVVLPVVQSALNMLPADRLGGVAPVTAFTQLPATTPLTVLFNPTTKTNVTVEWVHAQQRQLIAETAAALDQMHRGLAQVADQRRAAARARHGARRGVVMPQFQEGDLVLVGLVVTHANKLALQWRGPRRIIRVIHDYTFEVQNLCPPFETSIHHASRLQWYAEKSREITEDLLDQVRYGEGGHLIEQMLDARMGPVSHRPEIKVRWVGLDPLEASWEIAEELHKDVPVLMKRFIASLPPSKLRSQLEGLVSPGARAAKGKKKAKQPSKN